MCSPIRLLFGIEKRKDTFCLADFRLFWRKRVIFFKVQLYTDAFLRRKAVEKPFAAQTPPRKRGYGRILHTATNYASEISKILISHYP